MRIVSLCYFCIVKIKIVFTFVFALLLGHSFSYPQDNSVYLNLGLKIFNKISSNTFENYWNNSHSIGLNLSSEENIGTFGFGINLTKFEKKIASTENFYGVDYFLSYRYPIALSNRLSLLSEINLGLFEFRFNELNLETTNDAGETEREFNIKYLFGLSYSISKNWKFEILPSFQKIYTHKRIEFFNIEAGIKYKFKSPEWLVEFFN